MLKLGYSAVKLLRGVVPTFVHEYANVRFFQFLESAKVSIGVRTFRSYWIRVRCGNIRYRGQERMWVFGYFWKSMLVCMVESQQSCERNPFAQDIWYFQASMVANALAKFDGNRKHRLAIGSVPSDMHLLKALQWVLYFSFVTHNYCVLCLHLFHCSFFSILLSWWPGAMCMMSVLLGFAVLRAYLKIRCAVSIFHRTKGSSPKANIPGISH